jgi:hypothetical protein
VTAVSSQTDVERTPGGAGTGSPSPSGSGADRVLRRRAGGAAAVARAVVAVAVVGVAVSAVVVGALSLVGDRWEPLSDWSAMMIRIGQVGGADTPLVGPYSFHGFAHPGPLLYWLAAPAYRLSGGDPRTMLWTGTAINVAAVAGLAAVAWRRGRWPLLLGTMALVAQLAHGLGQRVLVDLWNPYASLLPFLLAVVLAWDLALGHRRSLVPLVVVASFVMQSHLAFVPLLAVVGLWCAWWVRRDGVEGEGWWRTARPALVVAAVLWAAPAVDALVGWHNPGRVLLSLVRPGTKVGLADGLAIVGRYVRPDGWWAFGGEPSKIATEFGPDALAVPLLALLLAGCALVARRRGLRDASALATLALVLLVAAVPATSRLVTPTPEYLTEWLKVVGGLAWFAVAWTAWRLLDARRAAAPAGRPATGLRAGVAAAALATVAVLVGAAAVSLPDAVETPLPPGDTVGIAPALREAAERELDPDLVYRVELVGDQDVQYSGLIRTLIESGLTIVTRDNRSGQKWGRTHAWEDGDHADVSLTLAVDVPGVAANRFLRCAADPDVRQVFDSGGLTEPARAELEDINWRNLTAPATVTDAERERAADLNERAARVVLYAGDHVCGGRDESDERAPS